ncbi:hypothetical protein [Chryseobacterium phocaeense]|uniref:hypothetical protein n=1 Tax=Chryseobacterium phocaeense TaxID=1816690 RepID=UPI0013EF3437|nr:hypothetical protein [Chryseobacterium phocaeense]
MEPHADVPERGFEISDDVLMWEFDDVMIGIDRYLELIGICFMNFCSQIFYPNSA